MIKQPVIGLTSTRILTDTGFLTGMPVSILNSDYSNAVSNHGGFPIILPPVSKEEELMQSVDLCDGFMITGGRDIAPLTYHTVPHCNCNAFDLEVDRIHISLIKRILESQKPMLGICRGMQLINVALGGTLYQDIPSEFPGQSGHQFGFIRSQAVHPVRIQKDSLLYNILQTETIEVNSIHHQAVKDLGKGVKICAAALDGTVEGITVENQNVLAVQWHPEMMEQTDEKMGKLFETFISHCRHSDS